MPVLDPGLYILLVTALGSLLALAYKNLDDAKKLNKEATQTALSCEKIIDREVNDAVLYALVRAKRTPAEADRPKTSEIRKMPYNEFKKMREKWFGGFYIDEQDGERIRFLDQVSVDLAELSDSVSGYVNKVSGGLAAGVKLVLLILAVGICDYFGIVLTCLQTYPWSGIVLVLVGVVALKFATDYSTQGLLSIRKNTRLGQKIEDLKKGRDIPNIQIRLEEVFELVE